MTEQEFNEIRSRIDYELQPYIWSDEDEKAYNEALDAYYYKDCNDKEDVVLALKGLCDLISRKRKVIPKYEGCGTENKNLTKEKTTTAIYYRIPARITADKIFTDGRNISQMPVFDEQECTEYIRKEALLEWAKEKREWYEGTDFADVYQKIIDKLNSL